MSSTEIKCCLPNEKQFLQENGKTYYNDRRLLRGHCKARSNLNDGVTRLVMAHLYKFHLDKGENDVGFALWEPGAPAPKTGSSRSFIIPRISFYCLILRIIQDILLYRKGNPMSLLHVFSILFAFFS